MAKKKIIKDNRGQWAHPGKVTQIDSNDITMRGVGYPVLGISDTNHVQLMFPEQDYKFHGNKVTEYPITNMAQAKSGINIKKSKGIKWNKGQDGLILNQPNLVASSDPSYEAIPTFRNKTEHDEYYRQKTLSRHKGSDLYDDYMKFGVTGVGQNDKADALLLAMGGIPQYIEPKKPVQPKKRSSILDVGFKPQKTKGYRYNKGLPDIESITKPQFEHGGYIKAQQGYSMLDLQNGATQIQVDNASQSPYYNFPQYGTLPQGSQNVGNSNFAKNAYNKIGGAAGIASAVGSIGNALQTDSSRGGPSGAQQAVGQFGPWGAAISAVSQIGTGITDESDNVAVYTAGKTIFDPAAAWTNKDLSKTDRILGGLNPIYGGIKAFEAKKARQKKEKQLKDLLDKAANLKPDQPQRKYVRPEDQMVEPNQIGSAYGTGTNYLQYGGMVPKMKKGGELETYWGGDAHTISQNPYLPNEGETIMFRGNSHDEGGIGMKFGGNKVEVEGGEPAIKLKDGDKDSLVVFGDMKIPSYGIAEIGDPKAKGKKFKNYIADLSKQENKQNSIIEKGTKLVNETPVTNSYDRLTVSSGNLMMKGGDMKLKQIAAKKQAAANVQNAILETAKEMNLDSSELAKGKIKKAKFGGKYAQDGGEFVIPRSRMSQYEQYGYILDPEDQNRMYKDIQSETSGKSSKYIKLPKASGGPQANEETYWNTFLIPNLQKGVSPQELVDKGYMSKNKINKAQQYYQALSEPTNSTQTKRDYIYLQDDPIAQVAQNSQETPSPVKTRTKQRFPWEIVANSILPFIRPTNQLALDENQLLGERYALANNQLEPVQAQLYHPLLEQVSDISLQDQMNANQADFNSLKRLTASNPAAQASLAAQKYQANSSILGEQFRMNQGRKMDVFNRNRQTLNDAQLKNLGILDNQYSRQAQAKSNTKAVAQAAISSISDKIQRNKLENRTLGIYENLYNYRFSPNGRAQNWNGMVDFTSMIENAIGSGVIQVDNNGKIIMSESKVKRDDKGMVINSTDTQRVTEQRRNGGMIKSMKYY